MDGKRGGIVLRIDGELRFVPAAVALRVGPIPRITAVPGAPPDLVGIAMHEGVVVPVVAVGSARKDLVVCQHAGELVGLVGGEVQRTGSFDVAADRPDLVMFEGESVKPLDVAAAYARVQSSARRHVW